MTISHFSGGGKLVNKKDRIVHSAIEVFREKGIEKAKISDIVKGAGIAQGTFYLYFSSKLSVMPAIAEVMVQRMLGTIRQAAEGEAHFETQLRKVIDAVFSITKEDHDIFALIYAGMAATEYLHEWDSIYDAYYDWMASQLSRAQERQEISDVIEPLETAMLLVGLIETSAEQLYLYAPYGQFDEKKKKEQVLRFAAQALGLKLQRGSG